ncbi:hypothetical protein NCS56_00387700 [Fusarium sp. Ph1]|nr:hypothetical protein NCS56_00387700 [Fusarium sp. Ph1]
MFGACTQPLSAACQQRTSLSLFPLHQEFQEASISELGEHIARANYGIIVEKPRPEESAPSKNTKRYPVDTTIRWLVKFRETIQVDRAITVDITKRLEKSDQGKWTEKIVWLKGESSYLPTNVKEGWTCGMKELHSVDIEVRQTQTRWGWGRTPCRNRDFKLMLVVGPSGDCVVEVSENVIKRSG